MTGKVRWFEPRKGYGFIEPEDGAGDVFVHYGCITGFGEAPEPGTVPFVQTLEPGDRVQFEVVQAPYGRQATQVRRADA